MEIDRREDEERIRQRAHEIWEAEGRPEGKDKEHWKQAEREFLLMVEGELWAGEALDIDESNVSEGDPGHASPPGKESAG